MGKLVNSLEESLFDDSIKDLTVDYFELGIDYLLENKGILKEVPIVKTIINTGDFVRNISNRNLLKQTLIFVNSFNSGALTKEQLKIRKEKIFKNKKTFSKELSRIIILLNRNVDYQKSFYLGKFFSAYFDEKINWNQFCELSDANDRLFISDIPTLLLLYEKGWNDNFIKTYNYDRLVSIGLLAINILVSDNILNHNQYDNINNWPNDFLSNNIKEAKKESKIIELTPLGKAFCYFIN